MSKIVQPVILAQLTQIFVKHYKMKAKPAAEAALKFTEIMELYGLQVIDREWEIPERVSMPKDAWGLVAELTKAETTARKPWHSVEL
jgi:hypothetical protein